MEKIYNPQKYEEKIHRFWETEGFFQAKIDKKKKPFTVIMPPPNANAPLHVGFGVNVSVEDIMTRYHRMRSEPTLWLPGSDHASIATQVSYERKLAEKGLTRYDFSRKEFYKEIMKFTLNNKKTMQSQVRALGASCDWTRDSFTLDPKFDKPIYTTFKKLYDDGLIYRGERMINWCPRCQTALSDIEVDHEERKAKLWFIKYPLADSVVANFSSRQKRRAMNCATTKQEFIVVATTRPETMLGDTAVAVHPEDKRYKNLVGQKVILPLMNREIPIIADEVVDPEFGTGAVKVTPAHDPADFEIGQRHNLENIRVIGFDGKMTDAVGHYHDETVAVARGRVLEDLRKIDALEKEEDYVHSVGVCERCKTVIEPLVSPQWFVKIKPLAKPAIEAVKKGKIRIIPKRFEKTYFNWMENIHDWCISRQIWWGHQIPVWYCLDCGGLSKDEIDNLCEEKGLVSSVVKREIYSKLGPIVSVKQPEKCSKCGGSHLYRDPDTLDTWFSSGQWPYTTLGGPEKTADFDYFYPTSVMETGYEILFFWVARMIMLGLYATGEVPFKIVYLHGMVRDAFGAKMSKSRPETCINLTEAIQKHGADALRMALIMGNAPGTDFSLSEDRIKGMRNFTNKIWNAARFILTNVNESPSSNKDDKWILNELNKTIKSVSKSLENFRFDFAAQAIYQFFWHEFCDKYIELTKTRRRQAQPTLNYVLETSLRLLHPFMPFVTEAVWQKMKEQGYLPSKVRKYKSIMIVPWPETER